MRKFHEERLIALILLNLIGLNLKGYNPIEVITSTSYYKDLSDTYGGGHMLTCDLMVLKEWYGFILSFGHFQSQSTHLLHIPIEEINGILQIPIEEMAIMQQPGLSALVRPIHNKWIETNLYLGLIYNISKCLYNKGIDYQYSLIENKLIYLFKDYQLVKENHFGYQIGLNISFYPIKKMGIKINASMQDLKNGGTFFLVGGGLCFKIINI